MFWLKEQLFQVLNDPIMLFYYSIPYQKLEENILTTTELTRNNSTTYPRGTTQPQPGVQTSLWRQHCSWTLSHTPCTGTSSHRLGSTMWRSSYRIQLSYLYLDCIPGELSTLCWHFSTPSRPFIILNHLELRWVGLMMKRILFSLVQVSSPKPKLWTKAEH